ncbi:hypothetical protein BDW74DRAFT_127943 [Aspergillus multicolor]|uniref:uncharacterized protein n=1 Tax=Aspergillus multicolor TaxID=41759 RepID=UPI003CCCC3D9
MCRHNFPEQCRLTDHSICTGSCGRHYTTRETRDNDQSSEEWQGCKSRCLLHRVNGVPIGDIQLVFLFFMLHRYSAE